MSLLYKSIPTWSRLCRLWRHPLRTGVVLLLCTVLLGAGCVTTAPINVARFGPYPEDRESVIAQTINDPARKPANVTRTVTSVTEPVMKTRDGVDGWQVWAKIREHQTNAAGGVEVREREHYFLLQGDKVVLTDYPAWQ